MRIDRLIIRRTCAKCSAKRNCIVTHFAQMVSGFFFQSVTGIAYIAYNYASCILLCIIGIDG